MGLSRNKIRLSFEPPPTPTKPSPQDATPASVTQHKHTHTHTDTQTPHTLHTHKPGRRSAKTTTTHQHPSQCHLLANTALGTRSSAGATAVRSPPPYTSLIWGGGLGGHVHKKGVVTSKFCLNHKMAALPTTAGCSDHKWTWHAQQSSLHTTTTSSD